MKRTFDRKIVLEDGSVYEGYGFGSGKDRFAELVFNTSMVGYQEILSDLSYTDQAVVMTYPLIGNYGMCADDYESDTPGISALIVRQLCDTPSNFRCEDTLENVMNRYGIAGIYGIDTRMLTRHIRDRGSCKVMITDSDHDTEKARDEIAAWVSPNDQVKRACTKEIYTIQPEEEALSTRPVVVIDCGIKKNILNEFKACRRPLIVVPWDTGADTILRLDPCGLFISNGPGNPEDCVPTIETVRNIKGKIPVFGICLGHQIISLAYGAKTYKLKFGHRGGNHPVKNLTTGRIEITSQNHSYAVVPQSLEGTHLSVTHINLLDQTVEGLECKKDKLFSVQYHPESAPGPCDSKYLFGRFFEYIGV